MLGFQRSTLFPFTKPREQGSKLSAPQSIPFQDLLYSSVNKLTFTAAASGISREEDYFAAQRKEEKKSSL